MFLEGAEYRSVGGLEFQDAMVFGMAYLHSSGSRHGVPSYTKRATLAGTECRATLAIFVPEQVTALKSRLDVGLFGSPVGDAFVIAAQ